MAGIVCCVCGKKQSGWIEDYPLSQDYNDFRLCFECGKAFNKILRANRISDVPDEVEYMRNKIDTCQPDQVVTGYLNQILSENHDEKTITEVGKEFHATNENKKKELLVTSGYNFEGFHITKYIDFLSTQSVFGMGLGRAVLSSLVNITGDESKALNMKMEEAKNVAMDEMKNRAVAIGANAIIGIDIDFSMFADTMTVVGVSGTAVYIEKI